MTKRLRCAVLASFFFLPATSLAEFNAADERGTSFESGTIHADETMSETERFSFLSACGLALVALGASLLWASRNQQAAQAAMDEIESVLGEEGAPR